MNKIIIFALLTLISCKTPPNDEKSISHTSDIFSKQFLTYVVDYTLKENHFNKQPRINDRPKAFLDIIDSSSTLLTEEDLKILNYDFLFSRVQDSIFVIASSTQKVINENIELIEESIKNIEISFNDLNQDKPFIVDRKNKRLKNSTELVSYWKDFYLYNVYLNYIDLLRKDEMEKLELSEEDKNKYIIKEFIKSESTLKKAKEASTKKITDLLESRKKKDDNDYFNYTINSMLHVYDIHSDYVPPSEQAEFTSNLVGRMEGVGAVLSKEEEYIKIVDVIPGGGAWKSKQVNKDDFVISVMGDNSKKIDLKNKSVEDAVKLIKGPANSKVTLELRDKDKKTKKVVITRGFVELADTYVKHSIITFNKKKYGYILVPKFYRDFDDPNARNCSEDVELALKEFNKHKLEGVILDLRNNGGGSLTDANRMAGLFIKEGPIVNTKDSRGRINTYMDQDERIHYDGKLIVLVNKLSASASEIVAGALQDYNRALIVGSSQTYGKGTVQQIVNLAKDRYPTFSHYKFLNDNLGIIKFTSNKFYRISGGTTQYNGVVSDVVIPESYDYDDSLEKTREFSLKPDSIKKSEFTPFQDKKVFTKVIQKFQKIINESEFSKISNKLYELRKSSSLKDERNINLEKMFLLEKERHLKLNELTNELDKIKFDYEVLADVKLFFPNMPDEELKDERFKEVSEKKLKEFKEELEKDFAINTSLLIFDELNKN